MALMTGNELSEELGELFMRIKSDQVDLKKAAELNNTAGKLLKYHQLKLAASIARNEIPDNSFYEAGTKVHKLKG